MLRNKRVAALSLGLTAAVLLLSSIALASAATQLNIAAGDGQSATAGTPVKSVVCVVVKDANNAPVTGVSVTWGSITGGGSLTGETQVTDSSGIATLGGWTLGATPGTNTVTATSPGLPSAVFTATGVSGATQLAVAAGDNQSAAINGPLQGVVCAIAIDALNKPVAGVNVTFGKITGGGSLTGAVQTTDSTGIATLGGWTLGPTAGANSMTASSPGLNSVTFNATAIVPTQLAIAAGNNQTAAVGSAVPGAVCAIVTDANNNVVPGATVTWGNVLGGGTIKGAVQTTTLAGIATLGGWTLGAAPGPNSITATSPGLASITFTATGTAVGSADNVVLQWNSALLKSIQNTKTPPPIAARAMAMLHTGIFDAWAAYDLKAVGTQLGATLRRPAAEQTDANKETAISYAAYRILLDLFPSQQLVFDNLMIAFNLDPLNKSADTSTPVGIGNTVAGAILTFRHTDGSNQLGDLNPGAYSDYTSYAPVNDPETLTDPSRWQPLRVGGVAQNFLTPQWGAVAAFAIGKQNERPALLPKACATYPGKNYSKQAADLVALSGGLTDLQKTIAAYWADGAGTVTPPGHWFQFAQYVSNRDKHTLDDDVKLFFAMGNAMMDASIACWDCKRHYDSIRPISAIRFLYKGKSVQAWGGPGQGTQTIQGETFNSYLPTPSFPEYVSGHSTFSAAGAQILTAFTKHPSFSFTATIAAGSSPIEPNAVPAGNVALTYVRFSDAADAAGMSRRLGGIHFQDGDLQGRALGKKVGLLVWKKALQYIGGTAK